MDISPFLIFVALLAGAFSVLTPCVLVMLPVILGVVGGEGRRRVIGVLAGLEVSFIGISLLAGAALSALGLPPRTQELVAVAIIVALGVTMLVPAARHWLETATSQGISRMPGLAGRAASADGFRGGFVGGLGLGLVWAPCAGPILASVTVAANADGFSAKSVAVAVAYGIGMLGPLLLVLRGGNAVVGRIRRRVGARRLDIGMGVGMLAVAAVLGLGGVTDINQAIAENVNLTSTPIAKLEKTALDREAEAAVANARAGGSAAPSSGVGSDRPSDEELEAVGYPNSPSGELRNLGPAPALTGINATYNLPAGEKLDADFLKGKVVVYDFWTYSCINCIRTLPYLRQLHEKYAKDGLVILGVHTPEFAFEKDEDNVRDAIGDLDVRWPVATDPDFATWNRFHNRFWPAKYITDRDGEIRYVHYGEGAYNLTEDVIRELLDMEPAPSTLPASSGVASGNTPETYLGFDRLDGSQFLAVPAGQTAPGVVAEATTYGLPADVTTAELERDQFTLIGRWKIEAERSVAAADGARLALRYGGSKVFLVLGLVDEDGGAKQVTVRDSAPGGAASRQLRIDGQRLYVLRDADVRGEGLLELELPAGVAAYAFTFG